MTDFTIVCLCGCGSHVTATDEGFHATTCTVAACPSLRETGVRSSIVRKTLAYAAEVPQSALRHAAGLVSF